MPAPPRRGSRAAIPRHFWAIAHFRVTVRLPPASGSGEVALAAAIDIAYRKQLARLVLSSEVGPPEPAAAAQPPPPTGAAVLLGAPPAAELLAARVEPIPFPDGLAPEPQPVDPSPENNAALPNADVLV